MVKLDCYSYSQPHFKSMFLICIKDTSWLYHIMPGDKNQGGQHYIFVAYVLHIRYMNIYLLLQKKRRSVRQLIIIFKIYNLRLQTFKKFLYR